MNLARRHGGLIILATFAIALLLTVLPLPEWARPYRPPWYTLVLIYWTMALPERVGVGIGWLLGIIVDVMTGTLLGQHALGLSVVAFISHKLHRRIRLFPLWQQSLTVLSLLLTEWLLALWVIGAAHHAPPSLLYWAPPAVGMLIWPWAFLVLRDIRRRFQVS
jgi:rod shape-determining protein MreD